MNDDRIPNDSLTGLFPLPLPTAAGKKSTRLLHSPAIAVDSHLRKETRVSHFGDLVRRLRKERGLTLDAVAKKIGTNKSYISGIENSKVNPPSVKLIKRFAVLFGQSARTLVRLAWVDKAPPLIRDDAERFLSWCDREDVTETSPSAAPGARSP